MEKYPMPERVNREVVYWDPDRKEWVPGVRTTVRGLPETEVLEWSNTGVNTNVTPDEDREIDIEAAEGVAIQADTSDPRNTSTNIDVNVMASLDGVKWDSVPYAEMNLGDAEVKTMLINPGPFKVRLRVDNNASGTTGYVRAIVKVRD